MKEFLPGMFGLVVFTLGMLAGGWIVDSYRNKLDVKRHTAHWVVSDDGSTTFKWNDQP